MISRLNDKLPSSSSCTYIYNSNFSCGASYIGCTIRQVHHRISGHHPLWLTKGKKKVITSSILVHLVDTDYHLDITPVCKVIYKISPNLPYGSRIQLLHIVETLGIQNKKPNLYLQKKFIKLLNIP